jgi:hypothetical protein
MKNNGKTKLFRRQNYSSFKSDKKCKNVINFMININFIAFSFVFYGNEIRIERVFFPSRRMEWKI